MLHVFQQPEQFGLRIKLSKCQFFQDSVTYLGHKISRDGVQPTEDRVSSILNAPIVGESRGARGVMAPLKF